MTASTLSPRVERRDPDRGGSVRWDDDRAEELHVLEHGHTLRRRERRGGLSHRLHAEHRGEQQIAVEQMVGQVGIAARGQLGVGDQLDARVVDARLVDEAGQRQLALLQRDGRQAARPAHDHKCGRGVRAGKHLAQHRDAVLDGDGGDAVPCQRLEHAEALAHSGAGPHRPFQRHAAALRMLVLVTPVVSSVSQSLAVA